MYIMQATVHVGSMRGDQFWEFQGGSFPKRAYNAALTPSTHYM
jgi:hypothetical protein